MTADTATAVIAAASLVIGIVIGMSIPRETHAERMERERAEFEMMMKLAPYIGAFCGTKGCG